MDYWGLFGCLATLVMVLGLLGVGINTLRKK